MKRKSANSLDNYFQPKKKKKPNETSVPKSVKKKEPADPSKIHSFFKKGKRSSNAPKKKPPLRSSFTSTTAAARFNLIVDDPADFLSWKVEYKACVPGSKFSDAKFHATMKIKEPKVESTELHITTNGEWPSFHMGSFNHSYNRHPVSFRAPSPSLSKSIIQKNVRQGRTHCAIRSAMNYLKRDVTGCIRRLGIIVIEDAVLHPLYPMLVWLSLAVAKDFKLAEPHLNLLLTIVRDIAKCPKKDFMPDVDFKDISLHSEINETAGGSIFVRSLLLRASLGGMKCDTKMLRKFARIWNERFQSANEDWIKKMKDLYNAPKTVKACKGVLSMKSIDLIGNAVDLHSSSVMSFILPLIKSKTSSWLRKNSCDVSAEDAISSAVWHHNSKLTSKDSFLEGFIENDSVPKEASVWKIIKNAVRTYQITFLRQRVGIEKPLFLESPAIDETES